VPEHDADPAALYREERLAFVATMQSLSPHQLTAPVAATPLWTVHDVLAHAVAISADLNAQRFDDDPDAWTRAQVTAPTASSTSSAAIRCATTRCTRAEQASEAPDPTPVRPGPSTTPLHLPSVMDVVVPEDRKTTKPPA